MLSPQDGEIMIMMSEQRNAHVSRNPASLLVRGWQQLEVAILPDVDHFLWRHCKSPEGLTAKRNFRKQATNGNRQRSPQGLRSFQPILGAHYEEYKQPEGASRPGRRSKHKNCASSLERSR